MFAFDPTIAEKIEDMYAAEAARADAASEPTGRDEVEELIAGINDSCVRMNAGFPDAPDVLRAECEIAVDGATIRARWYEHVNHATQTAVLYFHGGGFVAGDIDNHDRMLAHYTQHTGVPFLSVDYRLAPRHRAGVATSDGLHAYRWLQEHAARLRVDPARIVVMGDSGGGGVAAGVGILVGRDCEIRPRALVLVYPMIDDQLQRDPALDAILGPEEYDYLRLCWEQYLDPDADEVSDVVAPSRLRDFSILPPTYIEVGELDYFRNECVRFAQGLWAAGVSAELIVRPQCPHGFDQMSLKASPSQRSWKERFQLLRSL